eukprot:366296-Chlamydomonas_euryale.AAC.17
MVSPSDDDGPSRSSRSSASAAAALAGSGRFPLRHGARSFSARLRRYRTCGSGRCARACVHEYGPVRACVRAHGTPASSHMRAQVRAGARAHACAGNASQFAHARTGTGWCARACVRRERQPVRTCAHRYGLVRERMRAQGTLATGRARARALMPHKGRGSVMVAYLPACLLACLRACPLAHLPAHL